ncbi:MAG: FAD-dependent oxidoreductase [Clostridia bacterium]|nr:FAD-dependent oxidoreductase [Clostridia bacterium]
MQSALDLANAGYLVHLVTESPSIGGKMALLDKTFPTNECAMCLLGPRMTDTLNHPNIRIHTCSTLEKLEGQKGNFTARVRVKPRYINIDECTACGDCEQVCPVRVPNSFNQGMDQRHAVYKLFPQAVPNKYLIEKRGIPPCRQTCPAGTNVQGYVALISQGKFAEALEVIYRRLPFAGICGRICHHPCEEQCNRGEIDAPVAIAWLKRAAYDLGFQELEARLKAEDRTQTQPEAKTQACAQTETQTGAPVRPRVAIVGAGPAGLTAAQDLALESVDVTVYDALPEPGGMLRAGIPRYRLPQEVVERETRRILSLGIEFIGNTRVGRDVTLEELRRQYAAVILATGLQQSRMLAIEGSASQGIVPALEFLRQAALGQLPQGPPVGSRDKVVVIGGGNVAIDAARTARRLGAKEVHMVSLESREEMPAHPWEIEEAVEEGVILHPGWGPKRFINSPASPGAEGSLGDAAGPGIARVTGVEFMRCLRVFDEAGRFDPEYDPQTTQTLAADQVIVAIGQAADLDFLADSQPAVRVERGLIWADDLTLATSVPGVFACGDIVSGPKSVVEAVASGHEAAESVLRYLRGEDLAADRVRPGAQQEKLTPPAGVVPYAAPRHAQAMAAAGERVRDFREVYQGYSREEAIEEAKRCLNCGVCSECLQCEAACQKKAVEHWQQESIQELKVGAVILAPGFELFDASLAGEYGYGYYANVMTSLEFERLLSSTGPTAGHVTRPSDGQPPRRVAFIQCVGSRDCERDGSPYCSSICCMYSTKEAIIAREHDGNIQPTIFYLDMRSYGKNFDKYVESAREAGVRYVRSMISRVAEDPETKNLLIKYFDGDKVVEEEFELVVLAVGVRPPAEAQAIAKACGIELNQYGFAQVSPLNPVQTTREGVYVAGAFQGPRDIPETVINACAAAPRPGGGGAPARHSLVTPKRYPPERDVSREEPRVGVFICHCGINIAGVVDVPEVVDYARRLPGVVHAEDNLYTCSQDTIKKIQQAIKDYHLNRVVVASCTIRTHQPLFREALQEVGLNQFYFEMANIRDQCSWVHRAEPQSATEKAKDLVHMAVAKVKTHEALHLKAVSVVPRALIIGGGPAGLVAALALAEQGFGSYIIEKEPELGGMARRLRTTLEGTDVRSYLNHLIARAQADPRIEIYTGAEIEDCSGHQGHFVTTIAWSRSGKETARRTVKLEHGAIIVAIGTQEYQPEEYGYGQDPRILTNLELEEFLAGYEGGNGLNCAVFIQCVGSREPGRLYCSRTCCAQSIKNALKLKEANPDAQVFILYRDIRTYAFMEDYYRKAREEGIIFINYDPEHKPQVRLAQSTDLAAEGANAGNHAAQRRKEWGALEVEVYDPASGRVLELVPDLVVLATGAVAPPEAAKLASLLKLPVNEDGFYVETHAKLAPIDFPSAGIFMAGSAHSPKFLGEAISQALGAVSRASTILSRDQLLVGGVVAVVDPTKCAACLTCVRICPYHVPRINDNHVAEIDPVQCQGCGTCAGECPAKAIQLQHYKDNQLLAKAAGLFEEV